MPVIIVSLLAVLGLAVVHLVAGKLRFLEGTPRSIWLSMAGGVSVAYVFVHLLPELAESQVVIARALGDRLAFLENHVYLVALLGLAVFYAVERTAVESGRQRAESEVATTVDNGDQGDPAGGSAWWLSVASFAVYNLLVGYLLLHRIGRGMPSLILFAVAMALHFVVNDFGLRERHGPDYARTGRWVFAVAVLLGWAIALWKDVPEEALALLTAFLAGGIVLNVLKEELPAERRSRIWPFVLGAGLYAALLLAL